MKQKAARKPSAASGAKSPAVSEVTQDQVVRASFFRPYLNAPAVLAFVVLAIQVAIPWSVKYYVTDDGSSHLYTALVTRSLLFSSHSAYSKVYEIHGGLVPNWGGTVLLGLTSLICGVDHAEKLLVTLMLCVGFFSFTYAVKALAPEVPPWTPIANFVLNVWFLAAGYYSFYIGLILCPLILGFYVRRASHLRWTHAAVIAGGLLVLFFTHVIAAPVAIWMLAVTGFWIHLIGPRLGQRNAGNAIHHLKQLGMLALALVPATAVFGWFAESSTVNLEQGPPLLQLVGEFPGHLFETGVDSMGLQTFLWPVVLCLIVVGSISLDLPEWRSAKGGIAVAAFGLFFGFLLIPDSGMGGNDAKLRFAWAFFLMGSLVAASAERLRATRTAFAIYIAVFLFGNLHAMAAGVKAVSVVADQFLTATAGVPRGASMVRLRYGISAIPQHYGYPYLRREPVTHLDSFLAARCRCIDLSDFQAPSLIFPVVFHPEITFDQRSALWSGMEAAGYAGSETLSMLQKTLPIPIDYVVVLADAPPESIGSNYPNLIQTLNAKMQLVGATPFMKLYRRTADR